MARRGSGPFPRRQSGAPAYDGLVSTRVIRGVVKAIQPTKYTCTVVDVMDGVHDGVTIMPGFINQDGGGSFFMPAVGSTVWLMFPSEDRNPIIVGGAALPRQLDEGDNEEDPNDFRMNRPVLQGGDQMLSSGDGNFLIMRKGGVVEIGSSQTAQRLYIPLANMITDICENYQLVNTGGTISLKNRREDESHGEGRTPVEFRMQLKDFSQDPPIIDVGLGRIADEDEERCVGGEPGQIVARVIINNRFRFWVDKDGAVQSYHHGQSTASYGASRTEYVHKSFFRKVRGVTRTETGTRNTVVKQSDVLTVARDRTVQVAGNLEETVDGSVTRTTGPLTEEITGAVDRTIKGGKLESVTGSSIEAVADDKTTNSGRATHQTVGGRWTIHVANAEVDDVAAQLVVAQGEFQLHNILGKVRLTSALTPDTALAELVLKPSGALILSSMQGVAEVEINSTGIEMRTAAGAVSVDNAGTTTLGPSIGQGLVVTTLTHPTDYITGAPILGSSSVKAGGVASVVGLVSSFVADVS